MRFYCVRCDHFFYLEGDTPLDEVKCPKCKIREILIELEFEKENSRIYT
jgi:DNA-directed RNA polymerase subunit RPC12/RpoP